MQIGELRMVITSAADAVVIFSLNKDTIRSMNGVVRLNSSIVLFPPVPFITDLDMHATRNFHLTSASLGSYTTVFNFGCDVITKKNTRPV